MHFEACANRRTSAQLNSFDHNLFEGTVRKAAARPPEQSRIMQQWGASAWGTGMEVSDSGIQTSSFRNLANVLRARIVTSCYNRFSPHLSRRAPPVELGDSARVLLDDGHGAGAKLNFISTRGGMLQLSLSRAQALNGVGGKEQRACGKPV
jgi:hypothetical protein